MSLRVSGAVVAMIVTIAIPALTSLAAEGPRFANKILYETKLIVQRACVPFISGATPACVTNPLTLYET